MQEPENWKNEKTWVHQQNSKKKVTCPRYRNSFCVCCYGKMQKHAKTCLSCFSNQKSPGFYQNIIPGKPVVGWIKRKSKQGSVLGSDQFRHHPGPWSIILSICHLHTSFLSLFSLEKSQICFKRTISHQDKQPTHR